MAPDLYRLAKKIGFSLLVTNLIFKKIFRINQHFEPLMNFTSRVRVPNNISIIENDSIDLYRCLSESGGVYIQAKNGVTLHSCLNIGPGVKIISANHSLLDYSNHEACSPIMLGERVWLGANAVILPGVSIGNGSVVGAGSVVVKSVPENTVVPVIQQRSLSNYDGGGCN